MLQKMLTKVVNKGLYYYSSGSPLRYLRKTSLYLRNSTSYTQRKSLAQSFKVDTKTKELLQNIEKSGFAPLGGESGALFTELDRAVRDRLSNNTEGKVVARNYFGELLNPSDFNDESIFVRYALQEHFIKVAAAYFGQIPILAGLSLLVSKPTQETWNESQLWHKDYDDSKILKLFIYFSDVENEGDGPFTFIPAPVSAKIRNNFIPRRITDEAMKTAGADAKKVLVFGSHGNGTSFFIDTARCYHMGSRCKTRSRVAYMATFTTFAPLYPVAVQFESKRVLSEIEKLVLNSK